MSTYNSKFSGAQIDELLEKVASGQVGGGGSSLITDAELKEMGLTHKHELCFSASVAGEGEFKIKCNLYNASDIQFTVDTTKELLSSYAQLLGIQWEWVVAVGGVGVKGTTSTCVEDGEVGFKDMNFPAPINIVTSIDFENKTYSSDPTYAGGSRFVSISMLIDSLGTTFTDTVTEL